MGLLDMLFGDQDKERQPQAAPVDPNAINPIYGVPEALIQEMKKEQERTDKASAWANLFGGAANIARGVQGGPPIYDPSSSATDPNAAMDGLAKRVMMFSQLRQNYDQQAQRQSLNKMLPDLAKRLNVSPEFLQTLGPDRIQELAMKAMTPKAPEQVTIDLPQGKISALKVTDASGMPRYARLDGTPLDMNAVTQEFSQVEAARESTKAQAKAQGEKRAGLETTLSNLDSMNTMVQQVLDDPNLPKAVGAVWDRAGSFVPGTDAYGTSQRIEQLKSNAFLSSIQQMRGMGQLSNAEGMKVEAALGRLNAAQNEKDFRNPLADVQKSLGRLREVAMKEAGVAVPSSQVAGDWTDLGNGVKIRKVQ